MPRCPTCFRRLATSMRCPDHEVDIAAIDDTALVPVVDGFALHARLGAGGFARVYLASRAGGERLALKIALRTDDWRFEREAAVLARVGSPVVPALFESGRTADGHPFLAMELVDGRSLADWLAAQPSAIPPRDQALAVLRDACVTVDAMHAAGVIHRDLKPENLMIHDRGVTAIDLGLARWIDEPAPAEMAGTIAGTRLGTPLYMAPEQCLGERDHGVQTDVYAVAVIAYELLCGRPPFVGTATDIEQAHVSKRPPSIAHVAGLPASVDSVFRTALAKQREDRHGSAGEFHRELADAITRSARPTAVATARAAPPTTRQIAVLAIDSRAPVQRLRDAAAVDGGELVHTAGAWYVLAFPRALSLEHGIRAAVTVGARLESAARTCVIHTTTLRLRAGKHGIVAVGPELDRVASWIAAPETGVLLTAAAAAIAPHAVTASTGGAFRWSTGSSSADAVAVRVPLHGRAALVRELVDDMTAAFAGRTTLTTIVGEVGAGKTRVAREICERATAAGATVLWLDAEPFEQGSGSALDALSDAVLGDRAAPIERADTIAVDPVAQRRVLASRLASSIRARAAQGQLAIVLDNAHWADTIVLDALETAALSPDLPLWIVVTAQPQLRDLRPTWGERAERTISRDLVPLEPAAARGLLVDLLYPADFIPEPILASLVASCEGLPAHLVQIAQLFRREGRIRRLRGTESFYLAGDDLLRVSATPLAQRLAERALGALPPALADLARRAAVLEHDITSADLEALDAAGELDAAAGLAALARAGLVRSDAGTFRFRNPLLVEPIRQTIAADRLRRMHAIAAAHLATQGTSPTVLARVAMHAAAAGDHTRAAAVFLQLGELSSKSHDSVRADQHYSAALGQLGPTEVTGRRQALAGRGRARMRMWQLDRAAEDLLAARELATASDDEVVAELLLEEATVRDWNQEFAAAAQLVERARPLVEALDSPVLRARWLAGAGRVAWREERIADAAATLADAAERAAALDDHETRVTSLLVLGFTLSLLERLPEAKARFDEVMALCRTTGDLLHLGVAHANRTVWCMACRDYAGAVADLERSRELAREVGFVQLERIATHNLAELLLWLDRHDDALVCAERSRDLEARFLGVRTPIDTLLVARIEAARGRIEQARELLAWLSATFTDDQIDPTQRPLLQMVELVCGQPCASEWTAVIDLAERVSLLDERLEIVVAAARAMLRRGEPAQARALLARAGNDLAEPWHTRVVELAAACASASSSVIASPPLGHSS